MHLLPSAMVLYAFEHTTCIVLYRPPLMVVVLVVVPCMEGGRLTRKRTRLLEVHYYLALYLTVVLLLMGRLTGVLLISLITPFCM
jgi:hypothetical protein